jgi:hypothetical protein
MTTRVVHCKREKYDVYIGRPGKWGNPFVLSGDSPSIREQAIRQYEEWIRTEPKLMADARRELRGKVLGCWCAPRACHGDVLARIANAEPASPAPVIGGEESER